MAGLYFLHLFQITLFIIHCLSKLSIIDHTVLENTIISMTQPGKMSSGVTICIYTDTSHKQRIHRWLQPVQSLNQCKRGPRPGYSTWEGPSLVFLSFCHKGKELGGQGTSSLWYYMFPHFFTMFLMPEMLEFPAQMLTSLYPRPVPTIPQAHLPECRSHLQCDHA